MVVQGKMKYIIMCGGSYEKWETPRQLLEVNGEAIVARTIRLLRENGITDIAISTNNDAFKRFGVPLLKHDNDYYCVDYNNADGYWCNCFYPMHEPVCYLCGDVFFSPEAIRTIIETETDSIMFFGSAPPFVAPYPKPYEEPFAFKVVDNDLLTWSIKEVKRLHRAGAFHREPIAWETWNVISGGDPNRIDYNSYVRINDYTCDIDSKKELKLIERFAEYGGKDMAEKKSTAKKTATRKTTRAKAKKAENPAMVTYRGNKYTLLDEVYGKCKLTDGTIHFWVRAEEVER